jgi:outer membrane lipoprotein-sorting protein
MLTALVASTARAETIDEVGKKLDENYAKLKSYTAKGKSEQKMEMPQVGKFESATEFTIEWMRRGDQALMRSDSKTAVTQNMQGEESKSETAVTTISDGKFIYFLSEELTGERKGQKTAMKNVAPPDTNNFRQMLDNEQMTFKLMPDETVDGQECVVVEGRAKSAEAGSPWNRGLIYFRKDAGLFVKMVGYDDNDKPVSTTTLTDIKLNADISPERFEFKAPPGVEVIDQTQMPTHEMAAPPKEEAPKEAPKQADEPSKPDEQKKADNNDEKKPKLPSLPRLKKP